MISSYLLCNIYRKGVIFMKIKNIIYLTTIVATILGSSVSVLANESVNNPDLIITTHEDVVIPNNVVIQKTRSSITYDPDSGIEWDRGYRTVWGSCQAKQGNVKLNSYSRARFEHLITHSPYLDSGRVWSTNQGRSYAESGKELYKNGSSGVAHTYYGI